MAEGELPPPIYVRQETRPREWETHLEPKRWWMAWPVWIVTGLAVGLFAGLVLI